MSEIDEMVEQYNLIELQQKDRLTAIYLALLGRSGYRKVAFSNGSTWTNCWSGGRADLMQAAAVDNMVQLITDVTPGGPGDGVPRVSQPIQTPAPHMITLPGHNEGGSRHAHMIPNTRVKQK